MVEIDIKHKRKPATTFSELEQGEFFTFPMGISGSHKLWRKKTDAHFNAQHVVLGGIGEVQTIKQENQVCRVTSITVMVED